jgi:putative SOS response-associated peptidase YedK
MRQRVGPWEHFRRGNATILIVALQMVPLHNRMPVVVDPKDWPAWLGEVEADPTTLLEPPPAGTLRAWPVSRNVNSPRNNSAELLEPIQA